MNEWITKKLSYSGYQYFLNVRNEEGNDKKVKNNHVLEFLRFLTFQHQIHIILRGCQGQ